jgi:hypothetical protein
MERRQRIFYWVLASAALMLIGAFGPWAKVFAISVNGTDGSNDGWVVVVLALASAALFAWKRDTRKAGIWAIAGGALGAIVTIYNRQDITSSPDEEGEAGEFIQSIAVQVGWGLNLAIIASISLAIAGIVWMRLWNAEPVNDAGVASEAVESKPGPATEPGP